MNFKRILAIATAVCILTGTSAFAETGYVTRKEVADYLLSAADFYNPGVERSDIIKGYEDDLLYEEKNVTRAEALVMLKRAFGELPELKGHNKRIAFTSDSFVDIPLWAENELDDIFDSGIVAGVSEGVFSPESLVTEKQLRLFVERVYSLYGTNVKDDFYATVNKQNLENMKIQKGEFIQGTLHEMQAQAATDVNSIIQEIVCSNNTVGSSKQKLADLYRCIMDTKTITRQSVSPIKDYIKQIDEVKNISELSILQTTLSKDLCINPFMEFSLTVDMQENSRYMLCFDTFKPLMPEEIYYKSGEKGDAYISYLTFLLKICGEEEEQAKDNAQEYFRFEKSLFGHMLTPEEENDVKKINNIVLYNKIQALFPDCDMKALLEANMLQHEESIVVKDIDLLLRFAELYNQSNIDVLKTVAKISVLSTWGHMLSLEIEKVQENLDKVIFGVEGSYTRQQKAVSVLQTAMPEYLGEIYADKYFDEKSKQDVLNMVNDIKAVFKERVASLDWLSPDTKERAIRKLDSMQCYIGYPDSFESYMDEIEILPPKEGGTYFGNMLQIMKGVIKQRSVMQDAGVNKAAWPFSPYTVNAGYECTNNSIVFPAAILQAPLYDKNNSYEENLGGIGYIIAHEMVHAFDSNGALFDENGKMENWWTEQDYRKFENLCNKVTLFYEGYEAIAGIPTNGKLTLSENMADMGAAACITQLLGKHKNPDYNTLYCSMANSFMSTTTRDYATYLSKHDNHADAKARINRVLVHLDEFYSAFDISENDGMYVMPEDRITVW